MVEEVFLKGLLYVIRCGTNINECVIGLSILVVILCTTAHMFVRNLAINPIMDPKHELK